MADPDRLAARPQTGANGAIVAYVTNEADLVFGGALTATGLAGAAREQVESGAVHAFCHSGYNNPPI